MILRLLIFLFCLSYADFAGAQTQKPSVTKRQISLELEAIEDASLYEIELTSKRTGKVSEFKICY